jgi:uncharacterized protein
LLAPLAAAAQHFPPLSGRVVDAAHIVPPEMAARISARAAAIEQRTGTQIVVATIPDLEGRDIADYGYRLGRHWGIGQKDRDNGVLLIVAPAERRVRVEVGYGLEPVLTDALASVIIHQAILPRFRAGDLPGGIEAGFDAIARQFELPPDAAAANVRAAAAAPAEGEGDDIGVGSAVFIVVVILVILFLMRGGGGGGGGRRRGVAPVFLWGPGIGGWGGGGGGGGGGFSGGGGSFGGGGASGGW